jgi:hypothetical protein
LDKQINLYDNHGASNDWSYVYLDDSAIVTADTNLITSSQLIDSTTEPAYSEAKSGWYNGSDLCIFAVMGENGSAVMGENGSANIREFFHDGDCVYFANKIENYSAQAPSNVFADVTLSGPKFATRHDTTFYGIWANAAGVWMRWRTNGQTGSTGHYVLELPVVDAGSLHATEVGVGGITVISDSSQKIEVCWDQATTNTITVSTDGWYFPGEV